MRRMFKRGAKARLTFSGGPHAPVNMADSMENAGSWTVSGSKEAIEVPKNFKDLRKLGVRNIAQYCAANVPFPAFFPPAFTPSILSAMCTGTIIFTRFCLVAGERMVADARREMLIQSWLIIFILSLTILGPQLLKL